MSKRPTVQPERWWFRALPFPFLAVEVVFFIGALNLFRTGHYLNGRSTSSDTREAWEAFGPDAFAADSAVYLALAGVMAGAILFTAWLAFFWRTPPVALVVTAFVVWVSTSAASLGILIVSFASGVPYRNFRPTDVDNFLYLFTMVIPALILVATAGIGIAMLSGMLAQNRRRVVVASGDD